MQQSDNFLQWDRQLFHDWWSMLKLNQDALWIKNDYSSSYYHLVVHTNLWKTTEETVFPQQVSSEKGCM